ncbi:lipopolysaccharide biosynthesis protein [Bacillus cereus]|uniref:lipopolysaccharide biosynthesis protein n=1 Tax=Bacillus cereus TaxID=1396 RepID=UPI000BEDE31A|nr:lipopolysaccharide biosynthesis protein [Bacillus cereus]MDA2166898.1 lipopolysaccharide biosynthesis protein [Bacillus cereus]PEC80322.1 lipopolysaccharide biosynthesis protein [Bacillus cereus]PET26274.1 lipopolysaccharide biosynthesis protein [Bacillus cereus]PFI18190.1 lipopolysaccharide biosynthesis protein [Bacillus cereus]
MDNFILKKKIINATKWSSITELAAKIISPITYMILARILAPEAFGVVATIAMIISFAEMFTDAGFQKYLVQREFKDDIEKYKSANVAFWTNLGISILFLIGIIVFSDVIADLVGNPGMGHVIIIASMQLPLSAFSSIQMALYRRDFEFKILFLVRMTTIFIPIIVTIPLALFGFDYWSLIIGTICGSLANVVILNIKSKWKPKWFYNLKILKQMLSFSVWSLVEAIAIWLTTWIDAFIIGTVLNDYYLGLYKTSTTMVNSLLALITAATTPILFSALSRLQNDNSQFNKTFFNIQRCVAVLVFPLGIGIYLYDDVVVQILFGGKWNEATKIVGIWALTSVITIIFGHYCSEVYRAKGRPKLSLIVQLLHLIVLIPVCIISVKYSFWSFIYARSWIRMELILVHLCMMKFIVGFPVGKMLSNVFPSLMAASLMGALGYFLRQLNEGLIWNFVSILLCIIFYFGFLSLFPNIRRDAVGILRGLKSRVR